MAVERVRASVNLEAGDRFIVLYGSNTSDTFCTPELLLHDIEQVLHQHLKSNGYHRVLFFSGEEKLYFLDAKSRDRCLPSQVNQPLGSSQSNQLKVMPGPLGRKKGLLSQSRTSATNTSTAPTSFAPATNRPRMQDISVVPFFETVMTDKFQRSAIVFSNAEDLIFFNNRRELFGRVVKWSRLPPDNQNRCIFVFHLKDRQSLQDFCRTAQFTYLQSLLAGEEVDRSFNIALLGEPSAEEIERLIHYFRLVQEKTVDWKTLQALTRWLAAEKQCLRNWYACFDVVQAISLVEARKRNWLSGNVAMEPALTRLEKMVGLQSVKTVVKQRIQRLATEKARQQQGLTSEPPRLHLIFKGNPGTGKTTVARLIGEIYRELGLLQRGHLVEVSRQDLVAGYVGQTAIKTDRVIQQALDGVLFIDEAYTLNRESNDFGQEAIDTLLKRMEDERHRLAVIVAGYPNRMDEFLNSNPGLKRRFSTEVLFEDYSPDELMSIFRERVTRLQGIIASDLESASIDLFTRLYEERDEKFGNAGMVENLHEAMENRRAQRVYEQNLDPIHEPLQLDDLPPEWREISQRGKKDEESLDKLLHELDSLIGLQSVKQEIRRIVNSEIANKRLIAAGHNPASAMKTRHLIFLGNPGTGKTTVARLVGRIFKALGLLKKGIFVEVDRADLVAGYVGQTAPKTKKVVESALDGVLFIDEAYALARSTGGFTDFGREAIDTLVPMMENERNRLVVILAGYTREMNEFIGTNPGIKSRIAWIVEFPDYNGEDLFKIFLGMAQRDRLICPDNVKRRLREVFNKMYASRDRNFGNGRDVRNFYERMVEQQKNRIVRDNLLEGDAMITFAVSDIPT